MSNETGLPGLVSRPSQRYPGWSEWVSDEEDRFLSVLGDVLVKGEAASSARVRMIPLKRHSNLADGLHGGALLAFLDVALFAATHQLGVDGGGTGVTVDMQVQMTAPGRIGEPLDAVVELFREGGRLAFLRGIVEQEGDHKVAAFSAVIKKARTA